MADHISMLVFFKLSNSVLFDTYLRYYLKKFAESYQVPRDTLSRMQFTDFDFSAESPFVAPSSKRDPTQSVPMYNLVKALETTTNLIDKIIQGTATYSEIIAENQLIFQQLEIKKELTILMQVNQLTSFGHVLHA